MTHATTKGPGLVKTSLVYKRLTMGRFIICLLTLVVHPVFAAPVTLERIHALSVSERCSWESYIERSQTNALADAAALQAEVVANKMTNALRAPSGGDFRLPAKMDNVWYAGKEANQLADTVLSYQTPSGGWSKHTGYNQGPR